MDADDAPVGRILTRREVLTLFGGSAAFLAACAPAALGPAATAGAPPAGATAGPASPVSVAAPSCIVRPALTEGPYFVDEKLNRSDIRAEPSTGAVKPGTPLVLTIKVARVASGGCTAYQGAQVDLWQCDALGVYSDAQDPGFGSTKGLKFLRGYQIADQNGQVKFTTVYPGWYRGRATHIHFKIRTTASGRTSGFTSQLFLDDALSDTVYTQQAPYSQKGIAGRTRNAQDGIYRSGGDKLLLAPARSGEGYAATFEIGLTG